MTARERKAAGAEGGYKVIQMATAEEVKQKLGTLSRRYRKDLDLYTNIHAHNLFLQNGWEPVRDSSWSIAGGESGVIMEKLVGPDYCIQMKSMIDVAKRNGHYREYVSISELPTDVIGKMAETLDNMEAIMETVDDKFLMEAESNG